MVHRGGVSLFTLRDHSPVGSFSFVNFALRCRVSCAGMLGVLSLTNMPLGDYRHRDLTPLIITNNPYTYGPRPLDSFISLFFLNRNRRMSLRIVSLCGGRGGVNNDGTRFLERTTGVRKMCIPSLCSVSCGSSNAVGRVAMGRNTPGAIGGHVVGSLSATFCPRGFIIPFVRVIRSHTIRRVFENYVHNYHFYRTNFVCHPIHRGSDSIVGHRTGYLYRGANCSRVSVSSLDDDSCARLRPLLGRVLS